jgi:glycosyltransferase involved in cell wall biosynthesis
LSVPSNRLVVGLPFDFQLRWVGGVYYVRNLVSALALLPAERRPALVSIGNLDGFDYLHEATGYQPLRHAYPTAVRRAPPGGRAALRQADEVDVVLLGGVPGAENRSIPWVPDFQEEHFGEYFDPREVAARRARNDAWYAGSAQAMVSSAAMKAEQQQFYGRHGAQVHVVPFASFVEGEMGGVDVAAAPARYGLDQPYLLVANQIWRHKNHAVVLRALAELAPGEAAPLVVFTGKEDDYRNPDFAASVKAFAAERGVEPRVRWLGFIPRGDQLALMKGALAVIQPSLCEGWSTVIEDAKALGVPVLASDIAVHREQLPGGTFFHPHDAQGLAALIRQHRDAPPPFTPVDYAAARQGFAEALGGMIEQAAAAFADYPRLLMRSPWPPLGGAS